MKYEINPKSARGLLIDSTPIFSDIKDTFEVSFLLCDGSYIALFKGVDGVEYRKAIKDGVCKIPKELLNKEQYVELIVSKVEEDRIIQSWACDPLKITAFLNLRKTQWQLSGGTTENDLIMRLNLIETKIEHLKALESRIAELEEKAHVHKIIK